MYLLRCSDGSYYTGTARSGLEQRVAEHNAGTYDGYTAKLRPVTLVFSEWFDQITDAIAAERQVKGWSRAKKDAGRFRSTARAFQMAPINLNLSPSFETRSSRQGPTGTLLRMRPECVSRSAALPWRLQLGRAEWQWRLARQSFRDIGVDVDELHDCLWLLVTVPTLPIARSRAKVADFVQLE